MCVDDRTSDTFLRIARVCAGTMGTRAVTVGAAAGAAGMSSEAGLVGMSGVPRLLEDLARLSEDKDSADIVFLLGRDETPVYAHRLILQARSVSYNII